MKFPYGAKVKVIDLEKTKELYELDDDGIMENSFNKNEILTVEDASFLVNLSFIDEDMLDDLVVLKGHEEGNDFYFYSVDDVELVEE